MDNKKKFLSKEEKFIILIDKYICAEYKPEDDIFTYKLYLFFVGYHLKYFYSGNSYSSSTNNVDNIMQMFCGLFKCMKSNFISNLQNKEVLFIQLNTLVDYIEGNQIRLEQVYVELKAQYEKREITNRIKNKSDIRKRVRL
ncbi:hypothetical protein [Yersinia ruckeri]|uniref:hypothetical protein n=1 Tax=Yersinia ruckeri TaxID=29486 RepID=UPI002237B03F|nr:hypothetical protein [Yersinia ruckeri]MCW6541745.1 hypothetical protein [Yersinia ruckeri]MCW6590127.1 hypothetical protein [Yersinia ruckeri]UZX92166.1 hypothetical protein ND439_02075 [Yersinia ruckeri]